MGQAFEQVLVLNIPAHTDTDYCPVQVPGTAAAPAPGDISWPGARGEERKHGAHRHQHSTEISKQEGEKRQFNEGG